MSAHYEQLKTALFHGKTAVRHIRKALDLLGCDADDDDAAEPVEESGLVPAPPEQDVSGPDFIEPLPTDPAIQNPQSRGRFNPRSLRGVALGVS
jgi:hypothetical protein